MDVQSWITLVVVCAIALALLRDWVLPELSFLGGLCALLIAGVITPQEAFAGFSNAAVIAVGSLFIVAAGIEETGLFRIVDRRLFGKGNQLSRLLPRFMLPVAGLSAFMNNTPIVAMLVQPLQQWAARRGIAPSKVLIPLSYAAIAGGMITLVGTSTNVIVSGLVADQGYEPFGLLDFAWTGLPALLVVVAVLAFLGVRLLPTRGLPSEGARQALPTWNFEVRIGKRATVEGRTIEEADLPSGRSATLEHIRRGDYLLAPEPTVRLRRGDVLAFSGDVAVLEGLLDRPGFEPSVQMQAGKSLPLYEAVVSATSFLIGRTLGEAHFKDRYGAVVLAVNRKAERIEGPLRRVPIRAGDLLLLGAPAGYTGRWNASSAEFYYVAPRGQPRKRFQPGRAYAALAILVAMVALVGFKVLPLSTAAFLAAVAMIASRGLTTAMARRALDLQVLILIAAALGLGTAVAKTGLADEVANVLVGLSGLGVIPVLVALYVVTNLLTELIANTAAAVLMLPVALTTAIELGIEPKAFALTVAVAAAASFLTPVGYQTNLMVMAAGKYRVRDFIKVGLPISLLVMVATVMVIFFKWV